MACEHCTDPDGDPCLPQYGLAPHTHDSKQKDPSKFDLDEWIGATRFYPREEWPDTFIEDPAAPNHGTWYCSYCKEGLEEHRTRHEKMMLLYGLAQQAELMRKNAKLMKKWYGDYTNYIELLGAAKITDDWVASIRHELAGKEKSE
ncbi:hypothetical protein [Endozoicomonas lisbonensis]|uniref:Uncharacterized protein n=1 Tax=Endozoicomonas lisbonensis TaxID=3120522 RepID=A0ABV2SPA9_9GAMM